MLQLTQAENAFLFQWFSNVLGKELSEMQLEQYQAGLFDPLFELLSEQGFSVQIEEIRQALAQLKQLPYAHLELAADFTELFLLDGKSSALPYASAYMEGAEQETHLQKMDAFLARFNLQVNKESKEPSDHLGVYLELAQAFAKADDLSAQRLFLKEDLLPWLTAINVKAQLVPTKTRFYQGVLALLVAVITTLVEHNV